MVYLIESEGRNETYYKIGYAKDGSFDKRLIAYKLHNPFCKVLYTIPEATEDHEKLIQAKFNEYLVYRREWFKDSVKILRFFDRHRTKESLDNEFKVSDLSYFIRGTSGRLTYKYIKLKEEVRMLIDIYCAKRLREDNSEEIAKEHEALMSKYIPMLGKTIFNIEMFKKCFSEGDLVNNVNTVDTENTREFIESFKKINTFPEKMKLLCEAGLNTEEINTVLDQVPLIYKSIYTVLGVDRCRNLKYRKGNLEKELNSRWSSGFSLSRLSEAILKNFEEDQLYMRKEIKEKLKKIYSDLGSTKVPKATDLEEYFELKRCVTTVNGKREEGFRLIKRKE